MTSRYMRPGGALLIKPALALSDLKVNVDKDWEAFGITKLRELAPGMARGDILFFDGTKLVKLTPGSIGMCLTAHDWGNDLTWEYPP